MVYLKLFSKTPQIFFRYLLTLPFSFYLLGLIDSPCLQQKKTQNSTDWSPVGKMDSHATSNSLTAHSTNNNFQQFSHSTTTTAIQPRRSICTFCLAQVRKPSLQQQQQQQKSRIKEQQFCSEGENFVHGSSKLVSQQSLRIEISPKFESEMNSTFPYSTLQHFEPQS